MPSALVTRGSLLLVRARVARSPQVRRALASEALAALDAGFAGDAWLAHTHGSARTAAQRLAAAE